MGITKQWIEEWAKKYDDENQKEKPKEKKIFDSIQATGSPPAHLRKDVLMKIADWKAARTKGYIVNNDPKYVEEVTRVSFATRNEQLRLEVLTLLNGVSTRMASAILHFCFPERYSVMDWRAWKSLKRWGKVSGDVKDNYNCYREYNKICGKIAKQFGVSRRTLDKALWESKGRV